MPKHTFHFKTFDVDQDKCAMKIGTDSVLLGSWSPIQHDPKSILDIGAGTGVLALMMAHRSQATIIDAIEIDDDAYEQCVTNFEHSNWSDRLFCYHASLKEFTNEIDDRYDLILSNPPYFTGDPKIVETSRVLARFNHSLPFDHLVESASKLLSQDGIFTVVIPYHEESRFIDLAKHVQLYPFDILRIKGTKDSKTKRSLLAFSFDKKDLKLNELIIETTRHQYTSDYINLTKEFYLDM